jgi:hypothetical protein
VAEKFENANGAPNTEFERSIARSAASDGSASGIANKTPTLATEKVDMTVADVEEALKRNVFASVGIAALVGYLWGRAR